jgi:hypothetical protein
MGNVPMIAKDDKSVAARLKKAQKKKVSMRWWWIWMNVY